MLRRLTFTDIFISDGPLSLSDTTPEEMDQSHHGERSNPNISQTTNKLSESMTSLNSKQAPATSPSRQGTLAHQQSLQSNQSEVNGEKKAEPTGIKFERLKNLSVIKGLFFLNLFNE